VNVKDIIQSLGGPTAVGRRLDVRPQAVSLWVTNEQIPLERVPALLRMATELQMAISPEDLRGDYDWAAVCCCRAAVQGAA
jgi:DNA-binding transcriptional regulator YdaS (Cro superfamily)